MDKAALQNYEVQLKALQVSLQAELNETRAESAPVQLDGSMGRISRADAMQDQQLALEVKRQREERLRRVEAALLRVQQGSYGSCGRCRGPMDRARLDTFPDAVLCVRCASTPRG